jgi:uncharacterized UPF0160 family protein
MDEEVLVVTHDGDFHLDDVLGCHIVCTVHRKHRLMRTRDPAIFKKADFLIDVGGVYDPERRMYDHHQREFNETYSGKYRFRMSSSGLVFKHHIGEYLRAIEMEIPEEKREIVIEKLYASYFLYVDANDNGYEVSDKLEYLTRDLADVVGNMVPLQRGGDYMKEFQEAMDLVGRDLQRVVRNIVHRWLPSLPVVEEAFRRVGGEIYIYIEEECAFADFIHELNEKYHKNVVFVIMRKRESFFKILAVKKKNTRFRSILPLKEEWRGKRDQELSALVGIDGCIFVHATGFCGAHETLEGAVLMVEKTIESIRDFSIGTRE